MANFTTLRHQMVEQDLIPAGITDKRVLAACRKVPRHEFVPVEHRDQAYENHPLQIGDGQTISQPYTVALMTELLKLKPGDRVLEVGTGSGYQATIIAEIVGAENVYTIERHHQLAESARNNLERTGYGQVSTTFGDGTRGWPQHAPYNAVIVTAAAPEPPQPLIDQLAIQGRMVIPIGPRFGQQMTRLTKLDDDTLKEEHFGAFIFVPLIGQYGWQQ